MECLLPVSQGQHRGCKSKHVHEHLGLGWLTLSETDARPMLPRLWTYRSWTKEHLLWHQGNCNLLIACSALSTCGLDAISLTILVCVRQVLLKMLRHKQILRSHREQLCVISKTLHELANRNGIHP